MDKTCRESRSWLLQVKNKIKVEDYIRMNRGINDSKDLPPEYLTDIYEQIKRQEITLKHSKAQTVKGTKGVKINVEFFDKFKPTSVT